MSLRNCGRFKSANHKEIGSANRKSAMCHICGKSANPTNYLSHKFADLRFGKLICGPSTFDKISWCSKPRIYTTGPKLSPQVSFI